jgi:hypothetical protein
MILDRNWGQGSAASILVLILVVHSLVLTSAVDYIVQDTGQGAGGSEWGEGKIIGLVAVRNEEAMMDFCLRSLALFTVCDSFPSYVTTPPGPLPFAMQFGSQGEAAMVMNNPAS